MVLSLLVIDNYFLTLGTGKEHTINLVTVWTSTKVLFTLKSLFQYQVGLIVSSKKLLILTDCASSLTLSYKISKISAMISQIQNMD